MRQLLKKPLAPEMGSLRLQRLQCLLLRPQSLFLCCHLLGLRSLRPNHQSRRHGEPLEPIRTDWIAWI